MVEVEGLFLFRFHAKFAIIYNYNMVRTFYTHVADTCLQNCTMCKHSRQSRTFSSCCLCLFVELTHVGDTGLQTCASWSVALCSKHGRQRCTCWVGSSTARGSWIWGMSAFLNFLFLFVLFQSRSLCTPMQSSLRYKLSFIIREKTEYMARFSIWHMFLRPPGHKIMFSAQSSQQTPYMYKLNVEPSQFLSHTGGSHPLMFCSIQHFCPHHHYLWLKNRSCQISPANNSVVWRFSAFETVDIENVIKRWKDQQICEEILERSK